MAEVQQKLDILKSPKYSIDTSGLMDGYNRYYPQDVFPRLWKKIESLIKNGDLRATATVLVELERKDDDALYKWAKQQQNLFIPIDEDIQRVVNDIMEKYPRIVAENKQNEKNMACI